jgi:hypothetical protein
VIISPPPKTPPVWGFGRKLLIHKAADSLKISPPKFLNAAATGPERMKTVTNKID